MKVHVILCEAWLGCVDITSALTVTVFVLFSLIFFTHCRPTLQLCIGVSARKLQIIIPLEILQIVILLLFICCYLYLNKIEFKGYTTHITLNSITEKSYKIGLHCNSTCITVDENIRIHCIVQDTGRTKFVHRRCIGSIFVVLNNDKAI